MLLTVLNRPVALCCARRPLAGALLTDKEAEKLEEEEEPLPPME